MYPNPNQITRIAAYFTACLCGLGIGVPLLSLAQTPTPHKSEALQLEIAQEVTPPIPEDEGNLDPVPGGPRVVPDIPEGEGKPETVPGGRRGGECLVENSQTPVALLPKGSPNKIGLTVSSYPTILVYVPETDAAAAQFVLKDMKNGNTLHNFAIPLPETAGVVSVTLPEGSDIPRLQPDRTYSWTFALVCPSVVGETTNIYVTGLIQRVQNAELEQQVRQASARDVPSLYAEAGIWHDMLHTLAELRRANPEDTELTQYWVRLLTDGGLADVAEAPLVDVNRE